jgi:hypothetical protein
VARAGQAAVIWLRCVSQIWSSGRLACWQRLPIGEIPLLRGLASVLAGYDGPAELERGLDILLAGLTTTLTPQAK